MDKYGHKLSTTHEEIKRWESLNTIHIHWVHDQSEQVERKHQYAHRSKSNWEGFLRNLAVHCICPASTKPYHCQKGLSWLLSDKNAVLEVPSTVA